MDTDRVTGTRREALICVSLGGVGRAKGPEGAETWQLRSATDVKPPAVADVEWLQEHGLIEVRWITAERGAARLTHAGAEALRVAPRHKR